VYHGVPGGLGDVAELQSGILSIAQLRGGGLGRDAASAWVRQGRWQRLHRGVYATFSGEPSREAVLWAGVLASGPWAMLSYQTAAESQGASGTPVAPATPSSPP
jgi:hypothetical protein